MQGVEQDVAARPPVAPFGEAAPGGVVGGGVGGAAVPDHGHGTGRGSEEEQQQQAEPAAEGHRQDPARTVST